MRRPLCLVCLAFVVVVMLFLWIAEEPPFSLTDKEGGTVTVTGMVEYKSQKENLYTVHLSHITYQNNSKQDNSRQLTKEQKTKIKTSVPEGILCYLKDEKEPRLGSYIKVRGKISEFQPATNYGQFDRRQYYKTMRLDCQIKNAVIEAETQEYDRGEEALYQFRIRLEGVYDTVFPMKEASVMKAMLLGNKIELDAETKDLYQRSGIAHILAISGLHISIIGMGFYRILRRCYLPLPLAAAASVLVMYLYGLMIGMSSSSYRAIFMFALHLLAEAVRRSYDMLTAMAMAAVCIIMEQPHYVWNAGFQLSFSAILAIGLVAPALQSIVPFRHKAASALISSFSISLTSMPILLFSYFEIPIYAVFLNLLVIPVMTVLLVCGLAVLPLSAVFGNGLLSVLLSLPCILILRFYELLCLAVQSIPNGTWIVGRPLVVQIFLFYTGLLLLACFYERLNGKLIAAGLIFMIAIVSRHPREGLTITMLDVGQGDCFCVESESGNTYLIDGGSSSESKVGEYRMIPFLKAKGISELDYLFVTHSDSDHVNGIEELLEQTAVSNGIKIKILVLPYLEEKDEAYRELEALAADKRISVQYIQAGDRITDGKLSLFCLHPSRNFTPENANAYSTVLDLSYGTFDMLFTGDLEGNGESAVIEELKRQKDEGSLKDYEVLKAGHHGSKNSSSLEFLELCRFETALISCGKNNSYGHPHEETLARFRANGMTFKSTAEEGAVVLRIK